MWYTSEGDRTFTKFTWSSKLKTQTFINSPLGDTSDHDARVRARQKHYLKHGKSRLAACLNLSFTAWWRRNSIDAGENAGKTLVAVSGDYFYTANLLPFKSMHKKEHHLLYSLPSWMCRFHRLQAFAVDQHFGQNMCRTNVFYVWHFQG